MSVNDESDYDHVILDIRRRLHDPRGSKAAILVGSGFSRNALRRSTGQAEFPLWRELTEQLAAKLYTTPESQREVLARAGATSAALRLAQEFETAFGRPELVEFLRTVIRDDQFDPGPLHHALLELPWADVFTTNYDRLLETASLTLWKQHYEVVRSVNDLPLARRPRIIKLHGSFPELTHLVLTEEDYRTYPRRYAPFVAAVQAALTENVLCLVGFSGDDPNFLAWSGWLRDELRSAVPKTYLFTGDDLKPFQRQLLEERQIVAIPIKRLAAAGDYASGYRRLCEKLAERPEHPTPSWNAGLNYALPRHDPSIANEPLSPSKQDWVDTAILWRDHRQHYKRWAVLHRDGCERLWTSTEFWIRELTQSLAAQWPEPIALFVMRELIWRWSTSLQPMHDNFVIHVLDLQLERFQSWRAGFTGNYFRIAGAATAFDASIEELDEGYHYVLEQCLRHAREIGDDDRFDRFMSLLAANTPEPESGALNDRLSFLRYQRCLRALASLRHGEVRRQLESWNTDGSEELWMVRRAALCFECGLIPLGVRILEAALKRVRMSVVPGALDIQAMSVEGIVLYLLYSHGQAEEWSKNPAATALPKTDTTKERGDTTPPPTVLLDRLSQLANYGCDPNQYLRWLEMATSPEPVLTKGYRERDGFDIGVVTSSFSSGTEPQLKTAYRALRFIEDAGLPLSIPYVLQTTIAERLYRDATETIAIFAPHEAIGCVLRSRDQKLIDSVLTRECLVCLSTSQIDSLLAAATGALSEAFDQLGPPPQTREQEDDFWRKHFDAACSILGRIAMRLTDDQLCTTFRQVTGLQPEPRLRIQGQRRSALTECVKRLSRAFSKQLLRQELPEILAAPVPTSEKPTNGADWHNPVSEVADFAFDGTVLTAGETECVDATLAEIASTRGSQRIRLCQRISYLWSAGLLTQTQEETFASALSAHTDEFGVPADTGLWDSTMLLLPQVTGIDDGVTYKQKYLSKSVDDAQRWTELARSSDSLATPRISDRRGFDWSESELNTLLELAEDWLQKVKRPAFDEQTPVSSRSIWMQHLGLDQGSDQVEPVFFSWLSTIEELVLLNGKATIQQVSKAIELIECAEKQGWCIVRVAATRAFLGKLTPADAVDEIQRRLGDWKTIRIREACDAVVRWSNLCRDRQFELPTEALRIMSALLVVRRHEALWLLIETASHVIRQLPDGERSVFLTTIEPGLHELFRETAYTYEGLHHTYSIANKIRIRIACSHLARQVQTCGLASAICEKWINEIKYDIFADVRREADD